jgi:hypothetical protein
MNHFTPTTKSTPTSGVVVVAGCGNLADSQAMARWLFADLQDWPRAAWHFWIADATDCKAVRAAKLQDPQVPLVWQDIENSGIEAGHAVCRIIGGRCGLVIFAGDGIAAAAMRGLSGLVSGLTCFPASDPLAQPLKKSFASYGVFAVT